MAQESSAQDAFYHSLYVLLGESSFPNHQRRFSSLFCTGLAQDTHDNVRFVARMSPAASVRSEDGYFGVSYFCVTS